MTAALDVREVRYRYGDALALDGATLSIGERQRVALLGRNGSGKTTLLGLASGLLAVQDGVVSVCGSDIRHDPAGSRAHIGVVFQHLAVDSALTVTETLRLQAALTSIERPAQPDRIRQAISDAGLSERAEDRVGTLSGGLSRRLDLVRALLNRPALALMDEPTTGLDTLAREAFWSLLDRRRADGAQVIATHLMDEAERCDRVVILHEGRIVADGTPAELTDSLGGDAVWLDTPAPGPLADRTGGRVIGGRVMLTVPDASRVVTELYDSEDVTSVTARSVQMSDVFAAAVGEEPRADG
ncbi:MAG: ABC transporter ATP-binding protein [Bacteroidota bacterium]